MFNSYVKLPEGKYRDYVVENYWDNWDMFLRYVPSKKKGIFDLIASQQLDTESHLEGKRPKPGDQPAACSSTVVNIFACSTLGATVYDENNWKMLS